MSWKGRGLIDSPERGAAGRLKVCVATWAPFLGGAEIGAERVGVGLQAAGHEVFVVVGQRGAVLERFQQAGLRCVYSPIYLTDKWHGWRYLRARNAMRRMLRHERPDVIHSNDLPTHQMMSDAARGLGIPRVTYHKFPFDGPAIDWMNKFGAERHLFVSRGLMDEMCAASPRLRASSCAVVHDGLALPSEPSAADRRAARAALALPLDKTIVLFVGQIIERKGVADLLQAWSQLPAEVRESAQLVLLGDAPADQVQYKQEMLALTARLGLPVSFPGFQADVPAWLTAADVMVLPSHADPLPLAIMEAMAYGLPVIAAAVTGIPEMVEHEQNGLLVPPRCPAELADALAVLLVHGERRRQYGAEGRQRCQERFNIQLQVPQLVEEYRRLLDGRSHSC